jgi:hypothetical protein
MEKNSTPAQAIRAMCKLCIFDPKFGARATSEAIRNCGGDGVCPIAKYRLPGNGKVPVKVLRSFCLDCQGGSRKDVRECESNQCPMFPYRLGKNPNYKKVFRGGKANDRKML